MSEHKRYQFCDGRAADLVSPMSALVERKSKGAQRTALAEPVARGSKFKWDIGGPLVGGVDTMMSSDARTVVHLACSPLLHYAFRVTKLRGGHG